MAQFGGETDMRPINIAILVIVTLLGIGARGQSVRTAPAPTTVPAPGPQQHQPPSGRQPLPPGARAPQPIMQAPAAGRVEGFVYWDATSYTHVPASSCSGLAVTVGVGSSSGGPFTAYTPLKTLSNNFKYVGQVKEFLAGGKVKVYDVCTYGYDKVPVGPDLQVTLSVTQRGAFSPMAIPQIATLGPIKIINGQCNMLPRIVNPTASDLTGPWGTCQNMAYDVNFVMHAAPRAAPLGITPATAGGSGGQGRMLSGAPQQGMLSPGATESVQSQTNSGGLLGNRQAAPAQSGGMQNPESKVELNPQPFPPRQKLTNSDVIKMLKAGIPESVIVSSIQSSNKQFDFSPGGIQALQRAHVSSAVLAAMCDGSVRACPAIQGDPIPATQGSGAELNPQPQRPRTNSTQSGSGGSGGLIGAVTPDRVNIHVHPSANHGAAPTPVHIVRAGVALTAFNPKIHGFRFVNDFLNDVVPPVDVRTGGLCGGMTYAALDYYFAHAHIPQQGYRPANRTTLQSYLYNREVDSLASNLDKWAEVGFNPGGSRNGEFFNWGLQGTNGGRLQELRSFIDHGIPAAIDLQGDGGTGNHQVVAIGYDMGRYQGDLGNFEGDLKISVYDPNYPKLVQTLVPDVSNQVYRYAEGGPERWRTYFVDKNYHNKTPPNLPNPAYPNDGTVRELILSFHTGADDLRGGNDNINLTLDLDGGNQFYPNINLAARWLPNYTETARVILTNPVRPEQIRDLVLSDTFGGGTNGDNWDMSWVTISAFVNGKITLVKTSGLHRFSADSTGPQARRLTIALK